VTKGAKKEEEKKKEKEEKRGRTINSFTHLSRMRKERRKEE
jgi:hypothetical protein